MEKGDGKRPLLGLRQINGGDKRGITPRAARSAQLRLIDKGMDISGRSCYSYTKALHTKYSPFYFAIVCVTILNEATPLS